jgi:3-hydroxyisobutyrate dehydrogenase-like beta-hydroxyacid dehydrogenase
LKAKNIVLVDAPVSGGIRGAVGGSLAVMVSCPKATFDTVQPILKNFGKLFYTGEKPGLAQTAKLANNLMAAAAVVITSEAVAMGVKGGLDARVLIDIINASSGRNSASEDKFPRAVLPGTFDFGFTTGLSYKDVRLCIDEAEAMGVPMVCGAVVRQMLAITNAKYGASSDFTSIAKVLEEWAGVEMRG